MNSNLAQRYGLKLFQQHIKQYEPEDPEYETYTDKKGRQRRRRVCCFVINVQLDTDNLINLLSVIYFFPFKLTHFILFDNMR